MTADKGISRRGSLAAIAMAGAGLAGATLLAGGRNAYADDPIDCCATVTIADLRAIASPQTNHLYFVSDYGKEGAFLYDPGDTGSADNLGTVVVSASGARFKRVYGTSLNAKWFGAVADGSSHPLSDYFPSLAAAQAIFPFAIALTDEMDWIGIQAAIQFAASSASRTNNIFMPTGTYWINQKIRPEADDLELYGIPNGTILSLKANTSAIQVSYVSMGSITPVNRLVFRDFTIEAKSGKGPYDSGIVTLHKCIDTLIDNIRIIADSAALTTNNWLCSGLLLGEQSTGIVRNILVEGTTQAGILVTTGSHHVHVDGCETRLASGVSGAAPGIRLAGCEHVVVSSSHSHDNQGAGLQIDTAASRSNTHVEVNACQVANNGTCGIWLSAGDDGTYPEFVRLIGVIADSNAKDGICVEAGRELAIDHPMTHSNGESGIALDQKYTGSANPNISRVQIAYPKSYNNGQTATAAGISIKATDRVTIRGGSCSDTQATKTQEYGIRIMSDSNGKVPQRLQLLDVIAHDNSTADYDLSTVQAASGHFRLQYAGTPENAFAAPSGSEYSDLTAGAGKKFIKQTGTGTTGWKEVVLGP